MYVYTCMTYMHMYNTYMYHVQVIIYICIYVCCQVYLKVHVTSSISRVYTISQFIGTTGVIQHISDSGDLLVSYPGTALFHVNPEAVMKV